MRLVIARPNRYGFDYLHEAPIAGRVHVFISTPAWVLLAITLLLPGSWMIGRTIISVRDRRRVAAGCCKKCGYYFRATPDRCPECGAIPMAAKGARA